MTTVPDLISTVLGWAEYLVILVALVEVAIMGWQMMQGEVVETTRKAFIITGGIVAMISIVNLAISTIGQGIQAISALPGYQYIGYLATAAVGFAAIYGSYMIVKNEIAHGVEMLILAILIATLVSSGTALVGANANNLTQILNGGNEVQFSYNPSNWSADVFYALTAMPTANDLPPIPNVQESQQIWPTIESISRTFQPLAEALIAIVFIVLASWKFLFDGIMDLFTYISDILKELTIALIVVFGSTDLYNMYASIINGIAYYLGQHGGIEFISYVMTGLPTVAGIASAVGYFVPFVADMVGNFTDIALMALDLIILKFAIVAVLSAMAPLIAVFYLFPPTRGFARGMFDLFIGISVGGIIAGAILVIMNDFVNDLINFSIAGINVAGLILDPLLVAVIPYIMPYFVMVALNHYQGSGGRSVVVGGGQSSSSSSSSSSSNGQTSGQQSSSETQLIKQTPQSRGVVGVVLTRYLNKDTMTKIGHVNDQFPEKEGGYVKVSEFETPVASDVLEKFKKDVEQYERSLPPLPEGERQALLEAYKEQKAEEYGLVKIPGTDEYTLAEPSRKIATYKETRAHALGSALKKGLAQVGENLLANIPVMVKAVTTRIDNYLTYRGGSPIFTPTIGEGVERASTWLWKRFHQKKNAESRQ